MTRSRRGLLAAKIPLCGLAALALFAPSRARAAGFSTARFGGEHGSVVTTNPTSLYYNPGAMGFSEGAHVFLDGQVAIRSVTWDHRLAASDVQDPTDPALSYGNAGRASAANVFVGPAMAGTMKFGNLVLGAGIFVPFGGRVHFSQNPDAQSEEQPFAAAGVQRWHIIDGELTYLYASVGAAYRLGPLSIGISGNLVYSLVNFTEAKSVSGNGDPDSSREGRAALNVSGLDPSLGVGVMLEAIPKRLWLGASYQSAPGFGAHTLKGQLLLTQDSSPKSSTSNYDVDFHEQLPDVIRAGIKVRPTDDLEVRVFGDYTRWSAFKTQCISIQDKPCQVYDDGSDATPDSSVLVNLRRFWNDTYNVRLGVSYWLKPEIELFAGTGFETAATPDATLEAGIADANNVEGALGGRFLIANSFYLAASYTHLQFFNRDNTGKSQLSVLADGTTLSPPTRIQDGGGLYQQWVGIIDINIEKQF